MRPTNPETHLLIKWDGPFALSREGKPVTLPDSGATENELEELRQEPGLYAVFGDHPIHGDQALLYLGESGKLGGRLDAHVKWISKEFRPRIYFGVIDFGKYQHRSELRLHAESLLIFAHSPAYNSRNIDTPGKAKHLRIWNTGRFHRLLPEVSSEHPWYKNEPPHKPKPRA